MFWGFGAVSLLLFCAVQRAAMVLLGEFPAPKSYAGPQPKGWAKRRRSVFFSAAMHPQSYTYYISFGKTSGETLR